MSEEYEGRLLEEASTLEDLISIFSRMESYLGKLISSHEDVLDDELLKYLGSLQVELAYAVGAKGVRFLYDKKEHRTVGLIAQYEEVMENISVFQAGLNTKKGVCYESLDEDETEA